MKWTAIAALAVLAAPAAAAEKPLLKVPSYLLGPNRPMQIRIENMTMPECLELARDVSDLFSFFKKAKTISEQKNEVVYSICVMGKPIRIACRSPGEWVTLDAGVEDCK